MRIAAAALAWAVSIAAATFLGGFVGPLLGLGVVAGLVLLFSLRSRLAVFDGWTTGQFRTALTLAIVVAVPLWVVGLWLLARVSERAFYAYAAALGTYLIGYLALSLRRSARDT